MLKKIAIGGLLALAVLLNACASVPMAPTDQDFALKKFEPPMDGKAGAYVYRNSFVGQALKKNLYLDGRMIGQTANKVYFYTDVLPGEHTLSTESEFGNNDLQFNAEAGKNYYFEQYIKIGVFSGGANIKAVSEDEGRAAVSECNLAKSQSAFE